MATTKGKAAKKKATKGVKTADLKVSRGGAASVKGGVATSFKLVNK